MFVHVPITRTTLKLDSRRSAAWVLRMGVVVLGLLLSALVVVPAASAATPGFRVLDATASEAAGTVAVKVKLTVPPTRRVKVRYRTVDGTAVASQDYEARAGKLVFRAGVRKRVVRVPLIDDALDEVDETFRVRLSDPVRARIVDGRARVTVADDDPMPTVSVPDLEVGEGDSGTTELRVPFNLSALSGRPVSVGYAFTPGTATEGVDYVVAPAAGTVVIPPGVMTVRIAVSVTGDTADEADETVNLALSDPEGVRLLDTTALMTIRDDDGPGVRVGDVVAPEGTTAAFTVWLPAPAAQQVSVTYRTVDGTASAPDDFTSRSGTVIFPPGTTVQTITVQTTEDTLDEVDEIFFVRLDDPVNAVVADFLGTGTIDDDDGPVVSIGDAPAPVEGTDAAFTVALSAPSRQTVHVTYVTEGGTATAPADFIPTSGSLTFLPGETSKTFTVATVNDAVVEEDESFVVRLSSPVDAVIGDAVGLTYIDGNGSIAKATNLGLIAGDDGAAVIRKSGAIWLADTDVYSFRIVESISDVFDDDLSLTVTLEMPETGGDLDLCLYDGMGTLLVCSIATGTSDEVINRAWDDTSSDDQKLFYAEVRGYAGQANDYELTIRR